MNSFEKIFDSPWLNTLGYTLLHSLWEASIVTLIMVMILRFIPTKSSNIRYAIASLSLFIIIFLSAVTFIYLDTPSNDLIFTTVTPDKAYEAELISATTSSILIQYVTQIKTAIQSGIPLFLIIWSIGSLLLSLRIFMGLVYVEKLRNEAIPIHNEWNEYIQQIALKLNINRLISLAESPAVGVPVIIGYLKPIILIPLGMCASLSTAQLETIFLHELMHIRRKDYLINVIQAFVEAIYFFNPLVWIISEVIKREREHCCDDAVVQLHGNATAYAHALASLEEIRLSKVGLSVSLAENKNELLMRIKRLMEKSVKNYHSRERIIPALLLIIGLICASWMSMSTQTGRNEMSLHQAQTVVQDTTKKDKKIKKSKKATEATQKEKSALKKSETDVDADEQVENDIDLRYSTGPVPLPDFDFEIPPIPDVAGMVPPFPSFSGPEFDGRDWEEFRKEFEENFKAKFGDFYEKHEKDIQEMMEDVKEKVDSKFDEDWSAKMQDFAERHEELARSQAERWQQQAENLSERHQEQIERSQEALKRWEERQLLHQETFEKHQQALEERMKNFEERTKAFETELTKELIKDGYLGEDEKLENMHWHNGSIEINGKKVKSEDEKKYNEIHEKYFREPKEVKKLE